MTAPSHGHDVAWHTAITGTHGDKYQSANPLARRMVARFFDDVLGLAGASGARSVLDAGCGEGEGLERLARHGGWQLAACDWGSDEVLHAAVRAPQAAVARGSIYALPFASGGVDLVAALEVLEHLEDPGAALLELERVTRRWVLISVPREPLWRVVNYARGQYRDDLGNSPGHIQHWSAPGIRRLVAQRFTVRAVRTPFPWTVILAERRPAG